MKNALKVCVMSALVLGSTAGTAMADNCTLYYRTTSWSSLLNFTPSPVGTDVSFAYDPVSDSPTALHYAATGGSISKFVEVPPGFKIKKILVCGTGTLPASAFTVGLTQTLSPAPVIPFSFDHMSAQWPTCAVFIASGSDEWGPGLSVDPRVSPTVLRIGLPMGATGDITAVGLRLQADPSSPVFGFVADHQHEYLTGRGRGHNNTPALTSGTSGVCAAPPLDTVATDDILDAYSLSLVGTGTGTGTNSGGDNTDSKGKHGNHKNDHGNGKGKKN